MEKAKVAGMEPVCVSVVTDKVYPWCTCGLSEKQPFCDGKHNQIEGLPFKSLKVKFEKEEDVHFCMCKQTKNPPYCDGSHNSL